MAAHYLGGNRHRRGPVRRMGPTTPTDQPRKALPMNDLIAQYLDCWNETDPAARRKLIDSTWAADASYIDPLAEAHGRDAIDATIAAAQAQFPASCSPWPAPS